MLEGALHAKDHMRDVFIKQVITNNGITESVRFIGVRIYGEVVKSEIRIARREERVVV